MFAKLTRLCAPLVGVIVVLGGAAPAPASFPAEQEVLRLVNVERQNAGLAPLKESGIIVGVAERYVVLMVQFQQIAHNLDGQGAGQRLFEASYGHRGKFAWGENTAKGYSTPDDLVQGWMKSPADRARILNPKFTAAGVGISFISFSSNGTVVPYYCMVFAGPPA